MNLDFGKDYSVNVGRNALHCWGFGINYYSLFDLNEKDEVLFLDARIFRIDLLFFFINFTKWTRVEIEDFN